MNWPSNRVFCLRPFKINMSFVTYVGQEIIETLTWFSPTSSSIISSFRSIAIILPSINLILESSRRSHLPPCHWPLTIERIYGFGGIPFSPHSSWLILFPKLYVGSLSNSKLASSKSSLLVFAWVSSTLSPIDSTFVVETHSYRSIEGIVHHVGDTTTFNMGRLNAWNIQN